MNIQYIKIPFEHIIINNIFNQETFDSCVEEIKFVEKRKKGYFELGKVKLLYDNNIKIFNSLDDGSATNNNLEKRSSKTSIFLNDFFVNIKDLILTKSISKIFKENIEEIDFFTGTLKNIDTLGSLLSFYFDNDYYKAHIDESLLTCMFYYLPHGEVFNGGELFFSCDKEYTIKPQTNSLVVFPSKILHGVKKIKVIDTNYSSQCVRIAVTFFLGKEHNYNT